MATVLDITSYVPTTLLGLLGLISGYLFLYFKTKSRNKLKEIELTSRKDRVRVIEMSLNELGVAVDATNLRPSQKLDLIKQFLRTKTDRYLIVSVTAIILSGFVTFLVWNNNSTADPNNERLVTDTTKKNDTTPDDYSNDRVDSNVAPKKSQAKDKEPSVSSIAASVKIEPPVKAEQKVEKPNISSGRPPITVTPPVKKLDDKDERNVDPEPRYTYRISFFEGDRIPTPQSRSNDKFIFSTNSHYIYVHVIVSKDRSVTTNALIKFQVNFYDRSGNLFLAREPFTSVLENTEPAYDFHSGHIQDWVPGRYLVIVYINDIPQPAAYFTIE